jgi:hypothetical protein
MERGWGNGRDVDIIPKKKAKENKGFGITEFPETRRLFHGGKSLVIMYIYRSLSLGSLSPR